LNKNKRKKKKNNSNNNNNNNKAETKPFKRRVKNVRNILALPFKMRLPSSGPSRVAEGSSIINCLEASSKLSQKWCNIFSYQPGPHFLSFGPATINIEKFSHSEYDMI
jgi:hypothetical protein